MDYFVYCRDRDGAWDLRLRLVEEHWSFMDGYTATMTARGPTGRACTATSVVPSSVPSSM